jgi:hypothetical protein
MLFFSYAKDLIDLILLLAEDLAGQQKIMRSDLEYVLFLVYNSGEENFVDLFCFLNALLVQFISIQNEQTLQ